MLSIEELITTFNTMPEEQRMSAFNVVLRWLGPDGADIVIADADGEARLAAKEEDKKTPTERKPPATEVMDALSAIVSYLYGRDARTVPELAQALKLDKSLVMKALYQGKKLNKLTELSLTAPRAMPGSRKPASKGYVLFGQPEFWRPSPKVSGLLDGEVVEDSSKFELVKTMVEEAPTADAVVNEFERVLDSLVSPPTSTPVVPPKVLSLDDL
jgi:hypothetical protein